MCVSVSFSEYVTLYSKQINNYKLILLACEWLLFLCGSLAFLFFFFLKRPPIRLLQNRWGPKTGSLLVFLCEWSVFSVWVCVLFQHNLFVGKLVPFNCSCRLFFLFVSSFANKDWTFKTTTLLYCFFFFSYTCVFVFCLPFHKYIIVKKLETLIPLTYMYDHKVAY